VSAQQVNLQVPWELAGQTQSSISVTMNGQTGTAQTVSLAAFAPGIFVTSGTQGAILSSPSYQLVDSSSPAVAGVTYVQVFCTGLGPVSNQPATGEAAPLSPLSYTTAKPTVTVGGVPVNVLFSGLTPTLVGVYQLNFQVPAAAPTGPTVPVVATIGGVTSNTVTMAVQSPPSQNPQPTITSLSPNSAPAGSRPVSVTINGSGFLSNSSVTFNGTSHSISFHSSSQLTITLGFSDLATAGAFTVVVSNPSPGGGSSQPAIFTVSTMLNTQTVTVRSGNGSLGGRDSAVTFLLGPLTGNFGHVFTPSDFSAAQTGPAAFILYPGILYIASLTADPLAKWIGTNNSATTVGNTALYAVSFQIPTDITSATMELYYAVDDAIGDAVINNGPNTGVYLNGSAVCGSAFAVGFMQQNSVSCGDVTSSLHVGTNWLYIEDGNVAGAAGLLFSATITTTAPD